MAPGQSWAAVECQHPASPDGHTVNRMDPERDSLSVNRDWRRRKDLGRKKDPVREQMCMVCHTEAHWLDGGAV